MKLYKNRYCIALYEKDDDTFFTTFDNIYEFVKFQGKEINKQNLIQANNQIYKALHNSNTIHFCGRKMKVYLIDLKEEEEITTMKRFVKISCNKTITVTPGLNNIDVTNVDAHVPDRLKVSATWPKCCLKVKKGVDWYPAVITEWNTVKSLINENVMTVIEFRDDIDDENVKKMTDELELNMKEIGLELKERKINRKKLNEVSGEEDGD